MLFGLALQTCSLQIALILLPGPSVLLTIAHSLAFGWRRALNTVLGATCGVVQRASTTAPR